MRAFRLVACLFAVVLLVPACQTAPESARTPEAEPTRPPEVARVDPTEPDAIVCVTEKKPDNYSVHVKANKKQEIVWKSHDLAYTLYFAVDQWGFSETADGDATVGGVVYRKIEVPAKGTSRAFTLTYELPSGDTKEHHYRIEYNPPSGPADPPNGPAVIGEG